MNLSTTRTDLIQFVGCIFLLGGMIPLSRALSRLMYSPWSEATSTLEARTGCVLSLFLIAILFSFVVQGLRKIPTLGN
jgi:hypothetical protein